MQFTLRRLVFLTLGAAICMDLCLRVNQAIHFNSAENYTDEQRAAEWAMRLLPWEFLVLCIVVVLFYRFQGSART